MENVILKGERRESTGTRLSRALREAGKLPVVIYGHGEAPESLALIQREVLVALRRGSRTMEIDVAGKKTQYLIKEVQYDHLNETPIHLDLTRVDLTEKVRIRVGIELKGTPKGLSDGGVLDQLMADLEIECLMTQIPDTLHPLVTELAVDDVLRVKDIVLPEGVVAIADPEDRVATVKVLAIHEDEDAEGEEGAEGGDAKLPEVIGRQAKDEGDGEAKA
jgi:large subunit ribosomal protein L25